MYIFYTIYKNHTHNNDGTCSRGVIWNNTMYHAKRWGTSYLQPSISETILKPDLKRDNRCPENECYSV